MKLVVKRYSFLANLFKNYYLRHKLIMGGGGGVGGGGGGG